MKTHAIIVLTAAAILFGCTQPEEKNETVPNAVPVDISNEINLNEEVARDIATLDFSALVSSRLNITDRSILDAIRIEPVKDSVSGKVNLTLHIEKNAEMYKAGIEKLYQEFTGKKIAEYKSKKDDLYLAEYAASNYLVLLERFGIDSIWPHVSPTFQKFATKEQLAESFTKRKELFFPLGKRSIASRRMADSIANGVKGNFCTVTFEYQNHDHEEITMEKLGDSYKFLGYNFIYIPRQKN